MKTMMKEDGMSDPAERGAASTRKPTGGRAPDNSGQPYSASKGIYLRVGKRILDVVGALAGVVISSPALLVCALAVRLGSRGPVFFRQWRVGHQGRPFRIFKLRTMVPGADQLGAKLTASGDKRVTAVGSMLRKFKLDELPQLLNVLRGDMSLVGPRPEVPEYTLLYTPEERRVLDFKPGITGPASLTYIDEERLLSAAINPEELYVNTIMKRKLEADLAYCAQVSFLKDMKIIVQTSAAIFGRRFHFPRIQKEERQLQQ